MNTVKGLIVKDFQTLKSYKSTVIAMIVIFMGSAFLNDEMSSFFPIFMPLCFGMIAISSFSYDSLAKTDRYLLTFPVNRKDMVKARYIYILLFTLFGSLLGLVFSILIQCIKTGNIIDKEILSNTLAIIIGSLLAIMFLQVFQIPIMYRFGAEKGRIIQMLGISLIITTLMKFFNISLDILFIMLKDYLIAILGISVIILYILSFAISCRIYEKKEI